MKYISMKMDPKGRIPESTTLSHLPTYQGRAGIWRGSLEMRHTWSGTPFQFLPISVPNSVRGKDTNAQISSSSSTVGSGTYASDAYDSAIALRHRPIRKMEPGKMVAVRNIARIQLVPPLRL